MRHRQGEQIDLGEFLPLVYEDLRALARRQLRSRQDAHTLEPTALVNEVYLRLVDQSSVGVADRAHFHALCARVMRRVLVDHARARHAEKRGAGAVLRLETAMDVVADAGANLIDVVVLDEAIEQLLALDERKARVVELRIFCGLPPDEVASLHGVSKRTVEADWYFARAWLRARLLPD